MVSILQKKILRYIRVSWFAKVIHLVELEFEHRESGSRINTSLYFQIRGDMSYACSDRWGRSSKERHLCEQFCLSRIINTLCRKHHRNGKIQTLHARNLEQVCKLPDDLIEGSLGKEYNTYWMVYFAILWFIVFLIKQLANQKYLANIFSFNIFWVSVILWVSQEQ